MNFLCSVPCRLTSAQYKVVCRDICKTINYSSPDRELAVQTTRGLMCDRWYALPDWIKSGELYQTGSEVVLQAKVDSDIEASQVKMLTDNLQDTLTSLFSHRTQFFDKKVFCVGWPKTGTTSITEALRILGFFSWHSAPWIIGCNHWCSEISLFQSDFRCINEYDAVADLPACALFRELDKEFPGSLFILTTRSLEEWAPSGLADIARSLALVGSLPTLEQWAYGTADISRDVLVKRYLQHNEQARQYFCGRSNFLEIDLSFGNPWEKLCGFLRLPIPSVVFPHKNRRE